MWFDIIYMSLLLSAVFFAPIYKEFQVKKETMKRNNSLFSVFQKTRHLPWEVVREIIFQLEIPNKSAVVVLDELHSLRKQAGMTN